MSAPTLITSDDTAGWTTTTSPKTTASLTVQTGDVLVVIAVGETQAQTLDTPTGGGLTYTLQRSVIATNYTSLYLWTATATSNTSITVSVARTAGTGRWGLHASVWRGSSGVGATAVTNTTGAPSLGITTTGVNSAILAVNGDWNAVSGASRTWRTVNSITPAAGSGELVYMLDSGRYGVYIAQWSDAGAAGAQTVGLSAPTGQQYSIAAVEILGSGSSTTHGSISTNLGFSATAAGHRTVHGAISTDLGFTATASGASSAVHGSIGTNLGFSATAAGHRKVHGAISANLGFSATARGPAGFDFPRTALGIRVYIAPGADRTDDPDTYNWIDITPYVMSRGNEVAVRIVRGATSEISQAPVTTATFELNNRDGRFSSRNYNGPYWPDLKKGTPVRITVEDGPIESVRFTGRLDELPTSWDVSGRDIWVPVTASGIRRRLLSRPVKVPSAQAAATTAAAGYLAAWTCVQANLTVGTRPIPSVPYAIEASGGPPLFASGRVVWASVTGPDGRSRLPSMALGGQLIGSPPVTATTDEWTVEASIKCDNTDPTRGFYPLVIATDGDIAEWRLQASEIDGATLLWIVWPDGTEQEIFYSDLWLRDGHWHDISLRVGQDGADIDVELRVDGDTIDTTTISASTMGRVTQLTLGDGQVAVGLVSVGYVRVLTTANPADTGDANRGYLGETVDDRFTRLCAAAYVPYEVVGTTEALMGPQSDEDLLGQLVECEAVDGGILTESRAGRVALYLRDLVYNADSVLTLDVANGEIAPPFVADDSDAATYNIATATMARDDISEERTVRNSAHIATYQEYEAPSQSLNVYQPAQLTAAAGDRVWQGIQETYRYPRLVVNLARSPHLAEAIVDLDIYDRFGITNVPTPLVEDPDLVLIGYTEELGAYCWRLTMSTIRYAPFEVRVTSDGTGDAGWLLPDSIITAESVDLTETAIDVTVIPSLPTGASHYPINIRIDAEVMTVTACSGAGPAQTLTVTRGVSGLQATHEVDVSIEILTVLLVGR